MYVPNAGDTRQLLEGYSLISADIARFLAHTVKSIASVFRLQPVKTRSRKFSLNS